MALALKEPRLYLGVDTGGVETFQFANGIACVFTERAPGKETDNEDAAGLIPCGDTAGVLVVADGLGGLPSGEVASATAVRQVSANVIANCSESPAFREAILDAIEQANQIVMDHGSGCGTTLAAIEILNQDIRPYHVGDSEILVTGQRGKIKHQSISHSPVGYAVEAGLIEVDDAMHDEERHLVSNIIGTSDMRVEMGPRITMAPLDTLLIASDGLFDNLLVDEIKDIIRAGPLPAAAEKLVQACRVRMARFSETLPHKPDDLGFILFRRCKQ
ncbi:MAG: protein phosphatase 2C domain-containing protein [Gammaproteobacteria bacterium]